MCVFECVHTHACVWVQKLIRGIKESGKRDLFEQDMSLTFKVKPALNPSQDTTLSISFTNKS